ncbi:hypothetical protein Tco_0696295 [Tanacetum coccineum]
MGMDRAKKKASASSIPLISSTTSSDKAVNHGGAFTTPPKIRYKDGKDVLQMLKYVDKYKGFAAVLAVLVIEASQSRQHESCKSPTAELFDVDSGRSSIITVNTKEYHYDVLARLQG